MERYAFNAEYVARLGAGDPEVQAHFAAYFTPRLTNQLRGRIRSPELAEDIRQETVLRVLAAARPPSKIQEPERLPSYVHGVCTNVRLEFIKKNGAPVDDSGWEPVEPGRGALGTLIVAERDAVVRKVLSEMNERDRRILVAIWFEERDKDEVCREMRKTRNYLRVLHFRARQKFRDVLEQRPNAQRAGA